MKEDEIYCCNPKIIDIFESFLTENLTNENYHIKKMLEEKIIDINKVKENQIFETTEQPQKRDNSNKLLDIIRDDKLDELQEMSSQNNFNFNEIINPSFYEKYSFVGQFFRQFVGLIDFAAFFGSIKCFKYLLMNGAKVDNTGRFAVAGGNIEIIHLCEQNHSSFGGAYETAIKFHRNDIFKYIYENKLEENSTEDNSRISLIDISFKYRHSKHQPLELFCVKYSNYEILSFLKDYGIKFDETVVNESAKIGNLFLVEYLIEDNKVPKDILLFSVQSGNIELVKYILEHYEIDINSKDIYLFYIVFILIILGCFNTIFGNYLNYLKQHFFKHQKMVI